MSTASMPIPSTAKASLPMVLEAQAGSLHRHRLSQIPRPVDVMTVQPSDVIGEELHRDDVDYRGEELARRGDQSTASPWRDVSSSPSLATSTTVAPLDFTSATFARIFSLSVVRVATATTTEPGSMRAIGPCLSSPAGYASART